MRVRTGNPFREAHGRAMRVLEWIAPETIEPAALPAALEAATPGLVLAYQPGREPNGFVLTSRNADGSLYVAVCLYDQECTDPACGAGEGAIPLRRAPALPAAQLRALVARVGEHPRHRLGEGDDRALLRGLGFRDDDPPLRDVGP